MPRKPKRKTLLDRFARDSATVAVARLASLSGFVTGVIGALNWSPMLNVTNFDQKQMLILAAVVILIGVSTEVARRRTL